MTTLNQTFKKTVALNEERKKNKRKGKLNGIRKGKWHQGQQQMHKGTANSDILFSS